MLPDEIIRDIIELPFDEPVELKFKITRGDLSEQFKVMINEMIITVYDEANWGDDKIMTRTRVEYSFKSVNSKIEVMEGEK